MIGFNILAAVVLSAGIAKIAWMLVKAIRTGEVGEEIWMGAANSEDHFGYVLRLAGLVLLLGIAIYLLSTLSFGLVGGDR